MLIFLNKLSLGKYFSSELVKTYIEKPKIISTTKSKKPNNKQKKEKKKKMQSK